MKYLLTLISYFVSLVVVIIVTFFLVMGLAGPHGGLLPKVFDGLVLAIGWLSVLTVPVYVAFKVWRRLRK